MQNNKIDWKRAIILGGAFMATCIGSGFATGSEFLSFFVAHGIPGAIGAIAISLIIMAVVSANAAKLMTVGWLIIAVVMLHNVCGYALGYGVGRVLGLSKAQMRTLSIEVGMQNSGLATSLATMHFATMPLAAVPGAVFSVWHNISGAIYANILARTASNTKEEAPSPKKATSGAKA